MAKVMAQAMFVCPSLWGQTWAGEGQRCALVPQAPVSNVRWVGFHTETPLQICGTPDMSLAAGVRVAARRTVLTGNRFEWNRLWAKTDRRPVLELWVKLGFPPRYTPQSLERTHCGTCWSLQ